MFFSFFVIFSFSIKCKTLTVFPKSKNVRWANREWKQSAVVGLPLLLFDPSSIAISSICVSAMHKMPGLLTSGVDCRPQVTSINAPNGINKIL
jgi:hypothetical protein